MTDELTASILQVLHVRGVTYARALRQHVSEMGYWFVWFRLPLRMKNLATIGLVREISVFERDDRSPSHAYAITNLGRRWLKAGGAE